eukprot:TRINITY_DN13984_c0_g1_i3.p4 TRINITY_DN13984_c0_g1~~TRINITY_DN13984_c0_g1_i3.p4  ORF type:complete len:165 (-),score=7.70 TRINITY_DN13984_c0_g1_i3:320-814(-)
MRAGAGKRSAAWAAAAVRLRGRAASVPRRCTPRGRDGQSDRCCTGAHQPRRQSGRALVHGVQQPHSACSAKRGELLQAQLLLVLPARCAAQRSDGEAARVGRHRGCKAAQEARSQHCGVPGVGSYRQLRVHGYIGTAAEQRRERRAASGLAGPEDTQRPAEPLG